MDIPNKQICTPVMFFVCVVCSCIGTSRKAPVPDRLILFTERRHVGVSHSGFRTGFNSCHSVKKEVNCGWSHAVLMDPEFMITMNYHV